MSDANNSNTPAKQGRPSLNPSAMMRGRHPDLFSDSTVKVVARLSKTVFEYHLETLTSRKQEYEFEHFSRKIAEKLICPNLRVQTGPTGGGDSKVDSETYPVAPEISERWWVGDTAAGAERWAFAFSAKKDWKSKVKADVKNIISTNRDYKRIYFFTNQFASDKERAKLEDDLSKTAKIPVHVVDRSWLVNNVYENDCLDIAISTLSIDDAGNEALRRPGPVDTARLSELEMLDKQILDPSRYQEARYQLVEDCLQSALLARALERPRNEVEGRFLQTDRLAQQIDIPTQRMRVAYNRAWTSFWWYEDYFEFCKFYDEVEEYAKGLLQANEVERLVTLWQLLPPSVAAGRIGVEEAKVDMRRNTVSSILQAIADDSSRPNNALQARTSLALINATVSSQPNSGLQADDAWNELSRIVDESKEFGAYPIERLSNFVQEIGEYVDSLAFDRLFEKITATVAQRRSEGEAGVAHCKRGEQKLQHGKPYDAIKWFGRAEELLIKEEYRDELMVALAGSSSAYEQVGLFWAARNKILVAADRSLSEFPEDRRAIRLAFLSFKRIVWLELQLGRISHVLEAMRFSRVLASQMSLSPENEQKYLEEMMMQESVLGIHLFNIDFDDLPSVDFLPDILERFGLTNARLVLLVALGQKEAVHAEKYLTDDETWDELETLMVRLPYQPAAKDISQKPLLIKGKTSALRSVILGTELIIETDNDPTSFGIAESILGSLEAFLATSSEHDLLPRRERTIIKLSGCADILELPEVKFDVNNPTGCAILHPIPLLFKNAADIQGFSDWLHRAIIVILTLLFQIDDGESWLKRVAVEERAFARSLALGNILVIDRSLFGENQKLLLQDWRKKEDKLYERLRAEPFIMPENVQAIFQDKVDKIVPDSSKKIDGSEINWSELPHHERRMISPIDTMLWGQAKWQGIGFGWGADSPPLLGIIFNNGIVGKTIFQSWRERWGREDKNDELRIALITGISTQNQAHYSVVIGPGDSLLKASGSRFFFMMSRIHHMEPSTSINLDNFLEEYKKFGAYWLLPAQMGSPPVFMMEQCILKRHLHIRPAWQIGENDPDISAILEEHDPIVPPGVVDAPIYKALNKIRSMKEKKRGKPNNKM